jgi:7-cyano-7-deazaguanine reductase
MALQELDNSNINIHLGKTSSYKSQYDSSLLVREPRQSNRTHLGIEDSNLPFVGYDTWNGYEISGLTNNGLPVTGIAKLSYSCDSQYIVESKSIKLYFNSFNMTKLGDTSAEVLEQIEVRASKDLSDLLGTYVSVSVQSNTHVLQNGTVSAEDEWHPEKYQTIEDVYPVEEVEFSVYSESPELLEVIENAPVSKVYYHSSLLKSNCRVTSQPDWGDVYIYIDSKKTVDPISLLQYIVSFRDECHFHEEICEAIYKRLYDLLQPDSLRVTCLYARRGGIDINPERASSPELLSTVLKDTTIPHTKTPKQ